MNKKQLISAYVINNYYFLLKYEEIKAIYDVTSQEYYVFRYEDEIPKYIQDNYNSTEYYNALRLCDGKSKDNEVDLSLIPEDVINKFIIEEKKPNLTFEYENKKDKNLIILKKKLETYYKIKVNSENKEHKYYYDYFTSKYELLDVFKLGYLMENDFNITLTEPDVRKIYGMFRDVQEPDNDAIAFNNCILNTNTFEKMSDDTFTVKRINYNYLPISETKENTLVEKTLREIFIPANAPQNTKYYHDFLERNGASFKKVNKHKMIYLLTGSGDDGKSIVLKILKIQHGSLSVSIKPNQLLDNFFEVNLSDTNVIIIDELNKKSFNHEVITVLKDISGRGSTESRTIHSQTTVKVKDYGVIFIASNIIPDVPFSENAYWERLIIIKLPNKFREDITENDTSENLYKADDDLSFKLEEDRDGMEWLISASIEAYKKRRQGFMVKQSALETQFLYDGNNPIRTFIDNYIIKTDNKEDVISNQEIKYNLIKFCLKHNITPTDLDVLTPNELGQEIGIKLKNKFNDLDNTGRKGGSTAYRGLILNLEYDEEQVQDELKSYLEDIFFNG